MGFGEHAGWRSANIRKMPSVMLLMVCLEAESPGQDATLAVGASLVE